ncbi:hypothetical protein EVAR_90671_1 [Eumeta japonica]|uniref:Uncharacterized protein n=1 Tax=Eumeta variegata TaxID=151549 RepID=A0A4C1ZC26_EUMVA|nr:hypothetical protein EVAR_90671_1 [Eumeta japonica]
MGFMTPMGWCKGPEQAAQITVRETERVSVDSLAVDSKHVSSKQRHLSSIGLAFDPEFHDYQRNTKVAMHLWDRQALFDKMSGVLLKSRRRISGARELQGLKDVVTGVEKGMLQRFGNLDSINENRPTKRIYRATSVMKGSAGLALANSIQVELIAH